MLRRSDTIWRTGTVGPGDLVLGLVISGLIGLGACANRSAEALPPPVTVTVLPAAGAPAEPAAAGPITTTTTAPTTTTSMPGSVTYIVGEGETLYGIATKLNTTIELLTKLNPLKDPGQLLVNQVLIVPGPPSGTTTTAGTTPGTATTAPLPTSPVEPTVSTLPAATKDG